MTPRAVIVSGGTGALGQAVVETLLDLSCSVAVPYRTVSAWQKLRSRFASDRLYGEAVDLTDRPATRKFTDEVARRFGLVSGVAHLAGAYRASGLLEATPLEEWNEMIATNLTTAHSLLHAAVPHLVRSQGSAVLVSSRLAREGGAGSVAYAISKAGIDTLGRVLAIENADRKVRFNVIAPGIIDTPANRSAMPKADRRQWTSPRDIANVIAFLLSPESVPLNGAWLPV